MSKIYRQGDVLIKEISSIPKGIEQVKPDENGLIILAYGEVTNHHHSFNITDSKVKMFGKDEGGPRFIEIERPSYLRHQEHKSIELPSGKYEVLIQSEYSPKQIARVRD